MEIPRYKELLKMTKEKIDETLAPVRAKQAQKQAELEMAKLEENVLTLESEILKLCAETPIPFDEIIDNLDKMQLIERQKKQLSKIIEQLFGEKENHET